MVLNVIIGLVLILALFLAYVATRPSQFKYERSGVINAPPDRIFPYISRLQMGSQWSPFQKSNSDVRETYSGTEGQVGSKMEFESKKSGSGHLEILRIVPDQRVDIKLTMTKPFSAANDVVYLLTPEGAGTRFTWAMSGRSGFMLKLMSTVMDSEKMMGGQFSEGIANLKSVVEAGGNGASTGAASPSGKPYTVTSTPTVIDRPASHYVYVEKRGSIPVIAQSAWKESFPHTKEVSDQVNVSGMMAMYKMKPEGVYRAGMVVDKKPAKIPDGMLYAEIPPAKYSKFTMTGAYDNLPKASGQVWQAVDNLKIQQRDDFTIENYANNPSTTPEDKLVTEILVPTK